MQPLITVEREINQYRKDNLFFKKLYNNKSIYKSYLLQYYNKINFKGKVLTLLSVNKLNLMGLPSRQNNDF